MKIKNNYTQQKKIWELELKVEMLESEIEEYKKREEVIKSNLKKADHLLSTFYQLNKDKK